jgi:hypothetical protein
MPVQKHSVINSQAPLTAKVGLFPKVSITGAGQEKTKNGKTIDVNVLACDK